VETIQPLRIGPFDQSNFPIPPPFLDALLAGDGVDRVFVLFEVDKVMHRVPVGEAVQQVVAMGEGPTDEIAGDAGVERAVLAAGEDVNEEAAIAAYAFVPRMDSRLRGNNAVFG